MATPEKLQKIIENDLITIIAFVQDAKQRDAAVSILNHIISILKSNSAIVVPLPKLLDFYKSSSNILQAFTLLFLPFCVPKFENIQMLSSLITCSHGSIFFSLLLDAISSNTQSVTLIDTTPIVIEKLTLILLLDQNPPSNSQSISAADFSYISNNNKRDFSNLKSIKLAILKFLSNIDQVLYIDSVFIAYIIASSDSIDAIREFAEDALKRYKKPEFEDAKVYPF